jgi:predicted RNA binding protein YcfA (HicA-like mRNA interferase family)
MTGRLPVVTGRQLLRALERDGWTVARTGDHLTLVHPTKGGIVPVPNHPRQEVDRGTLRSILQAAGLTPERLRDLL